jgi:hypothetical protein
MHKDSATGQASKLTSVSRPLGQYPGDHGHKICLHLKLLLAKINKGKRSTCACPHSLFLKHVPDLGVTLSAQYYATVITILRNKIQVLSMYDRASFNQVNNRTNRRNNN